MNEERIKLVPKIEFVSRLVAEGLTPIPNSAMISIYTPGDVSAALHPEWDWLHVSCFHDIFHDIIDTKTEGLIYQAMTDKQAASMGRFIKYTIDIKIMNYYIHCDAGISRSAAVALFISEWLDVYFPSNYSHFNTLVYRKLTEWRHNE